MTHPNTKTETSGEIDSCKAGVLAAIEVIRPALQSDGGDIKYIDIDNEAMVHVELVGACGGCASSTMTLKAGVERIIMDRVPEIAGVINDGDACAKDAH